MVARALGDGVGRRIGVAALGSLLCCAHLPGDKARSLSVTVRSVEMSFPSEKDGSMTVQLWADNPLPIPARFSRFDWELRIQGVYFAAGVDQLAASAAPSSQQAIALRVPLAVGASSYSKDPVPLEVAIHGWVT